MKLVGILVVAAVAFATPSQAKIIPAQEFSAPREFVLAFVGDIHFEGIAKRFARSQGLTPISSLYADSDFVMANLETAITSRGKAENKTYTFRAPARAVQSLENAGITVVTMANNHALDYGRGVLQDSLAAFGERSVGLVGIGLNQEEALTPFRTSIGEPGQQLDLSVFAVASNEMLGDGLLQRWSATANRGGILTWDYHRNQLQQAIATEREAGRFVIVYVHWGQERNSCPSVTQRVIAHALDRAGASLVVGTHPHVLQPAGFTQSGMPLIFSTGNFVWYHSRGGATGVVKVKVSDGKATSISLTPAMIRQGLPRLNLSVQTAAERVLFGQSCSGLSQQPLSN